ncbi:MAG: carboxypeptidase-like regulatory domain-containing protein [Bacteroidota bacterium]
MNKWFWVLAALPLLLVSCREDMDEITTTQTGVPQPNVIVTASLIGQVVDENNTPLPGVLVRLASEVTTTDENGRYVFANTSMNAKGTYVTATRAGYFPGSDRLYPSLDSRNANVIQLLPRNVAGTIGNDGGDVNVDGATITFPGDAFAYPSGLAYNGEVRVYAAWLDPTAPDLGEFMPGGLYGLDDDGNLVTMTSFGMLAVELEDASGNEVELASGVKATLNFPVPDRLLSGATAEIPLWYFDEQDGIWIEEGAATLENGVYVGEVSHFTFWNVDYPYGTETVDLAGCVSYGSGAGAAYLNFTISVGTDSTFSIVWGTTDIAGNFYGPVPTGENLTINFTDPCGSSNSISLGTFTEDTELAECIVVPALAETTINGQLVDCNGEGISFGIVEVDGPGWYSPDLLTDENGNFSYTTSICAEDTEITITGVDWDNLVTSDPQTVTATSGQTVELGTVTACDNPLEEYVVNDAGGAVTTFVSPAFTQDSLSGLLGWNIRGVQEDDMSQYIVNITLENIEVGTYSGEGVRYNYRYTNFMTPTDVDTALDCLNPCGSITVNVTANGGPGGFLEGNYSGTSDGFSDGVTVEDVPISGNFRVMIP